MTTRAFHEFLDALRSHTLEDALAWVEAHETDGWLNEIDSDGLSPLLHCIRGPIIPYMGQPMKMTEQEKDTLTLAVLKAFPDAAKQYDPRQADKRFPFFVSVKMGSSEPVQLALLAAFPDICKPTPGVTNGFVLRHVLRLRASTQVQLAVLDLWPDAATKVGADGCFALHYALSGNPRAPHLPLVPVADSVILALLKANPEAVKVPNTSKQTPLDLVFHHLHLNPTSSEATALAMLTLWPAGVTNAVHLFAAIAANLSVTLMTALIHAHPDAVGLTNPSPGEDALHRRLMIQYQARTPLHLAISTNVPDRLLRLMLNVRLQQRQGKLTALDCTLLFALVDAQCKTAAEQKNTNVLFFTLAEFSVLLPTAHGPVAAKAI